MKTEIHITEKQAGGRIDILAAELTGATRSQVRRLIENGSLTIHGLTVKPNYKVRPGDVIAISQTQEVQELVPENLPVDVLYSDDFLIVVDKPAGMVVYPAPGHGGGTLVNAIAYRSRKLASVGGPLRPGVVHRLDKDTSGIMVVALDDRAYYSLVEQFRARTIHRRYKALVYGGLRGDSGEISARIGRSESDRKKMSTKTRRGKEAVTTWKVLERFSGATLIEARLGTGRTHQIRVHFASIGHPVLGDTTYGKKTFMEVRRQKVTFPRQMLHAELLGFLHPVTGEHLEFTSPLPPDMTERIDLLRRVSDI